jgi:hypothetical protein
MSEKNSSLDLVILPFVISVPPQLKHFVIVGISSPHLAPLLRGAAQARRPYLVPKR